MTDPAQHAADLRVAAQRLRWNPSATASFPLADRLEAHADALDAAVAAGEPCPSCAERMERIEKQWPASVDEPAFWCWRFVTPEAEK